MSTSSLAALKKNFGFDDNTLIKYEEKSDELLIRLHLGSKYSSNNEIIKQAYKLAEKRESEGWTRADFFYDFLEVRDEVIAKIREYYECR